MLLRREGDASAMLLLREGEGTCSETLHLRAVLGIWIVVLLLRVVGTFKHESGLRKFELVIADVSDVSPLVRKLRFLLIELVSATRRKSRPSTAVE